MEKGRFVSTCRWHQTRLDQSVGRDSVSDLVDDQEIALARLGASLARMFNEEPAQQKDLEMLGMLLPPEIEKGKAFDPDSATRTFLNASASGAHAWLLDGIARVSPAW